MASSEVKKTSTTTVLIWGGGAMALLLLAIVYAWMYGDQSSPSSGNYVIASLLAKRDQCRQNVAQLETIGAAQLTDGDGYTIAEYDDQTWEAFDYDDRVRQGLLIFCAKMPDNGRYYVTIRGRHSGRKLGSVVDGNYLD